MSTSYRFPTLDYDDLRSPTYDDEQEYSFRSIQPVDDEFVEQQELVEESGFGTREQNDEDGLQLSTIASENRRLARENEALRHCLVLTKQHCDLKTANYVTSALAWCDDRLSQYNSEYSLVQRTRKPDSTGPSSAFKPVAPKTIDTSQQTKVSKDKLFAEDWSVRSPSPTFKQQVYAEDWVARNTHPKSDPRNQRLVNSKQTRETERVTVPMPDSQPWHMTLRKYSSPSSLQRPKSAQKAGSPSKKSGKAKKSGIPIPVRKVLHQNEADHMVSRQGSFGFSSPATERAPSPRIALFEGEDYVRQRTPSPVGRRSPTPTGRQTPSPRERRTTPEPSVRFTPTQTGRRSPSPVGRPSSSPAGRASQPPVELRTPSPAGRVSPTPIGRQSPGRQIPFQITRPSPSGGLLTPQRGRVTPTQGGRASSVPVTRRSPTPTPINQTPPGQRSPVHGTMFISPMEPLVQKAIRSQLTFDSPTMRAASQNQSRPDTASTIRPASTSPARPRSTSPSPLTRPASATLGPRSSSPKSMTSSSPWSMISGSFPPTQNRPEGSSTGAVTLTRSPTPRSPTPGKICQGSPKTIGVDPLVKIPTPTFTEKKFRNRPEDSRRTPVSTENYYSNEGYVSHSNYAAPPGSSRTYELIGQPVAMSTPVGRYEKRSRSPNDTINSQRDASFQEDSLANLLGINGRGAGEKARGVVYRAVDTLTGYRPNLTPEVKFNLSQAKHNKRIVGEIAFQLDRRILEFVFAPHRTRKKNARYYGYSLTNIMPMIYKEAAKAGFHNPKVELDLRTRLDSILRKLAPFGYNLDTHAETAQDMVNKYGLLNGPPDQNTVRGFGLDDPAVLRIILSKVIREENELHDMLIMLDCLCYLSYEDGEPIFMW